MGIELSVVHDRDCAVRNRFVTNTCLYDSPELAGRENDGIGIRLSSFRLIRPSRIGSVMGLYAKNNHGRRLIDAGFPWTSPHPVFGHVPVKRITLCTIAPPYLVDHAEIHQSWVQEG